MTGSSFRISRTLISEIRIINLVSAIHTIPDEARVTKFGDSYI